MKTFYFCTTFPRRSSVEVDNFKGKSFLKKSCKIICQIKKRSYLCSPDSREGGAQEEIIGLNLE